MSTNMPNNNVNAQNLAWQNQHYDVIFELIQANLVFPDLFDISQCSGKMREFYETIESFHESIRTDDVPKVKEVLDQYPNQRYFYNTSNESALKIAILSDSIKTYEFLLSRKIMFGPHEESEEFFQQLGDISKKAIREIHNKYTQHSPEKHLNIFFANSFICHDDINAQEKMDIIQSAFRNLNSNALVKNILIVVAASKNFKIIFDFNRESVSAADPTVDSYTQGLFYPMGRIYIGAKQLLNETTKNETLANMAHELCHFAVNLTYCNAAQPYLKNDHKTMQEFEKISEHCLSNNGIEDIIDMVYDCYPSKMYHAELIVRVVHLCIFYQNNPEKLNLAREYYKPLFDFYENKVVPEIEAATTEIENRISKEIQKKDKKIYKFKKISIAATLFSIIGILTAITISIILHNPVYKFDELSETDKNVIKNAVVSYKGVEVKLQDLYPKELTVYTNFTSEQISKILDGKVLNLNDPQLTYLDDIVWLEWKNMTNNLKRKILKSSFIFQNSRFKFEDITNNATLETLTTKEIKNIFNGMELRIGKMILNETEFYVRRKYSFFKNGIKEFDFSRVFPHPDLEIFFVLSSDAGTGKTIAFNQLALEIKQKFPHLWVCFIDLKSFTQLYNDNNMSRGPRYILMEILGLKTKFERVFFSGMYNTDSIVLLWNGFDEVSPKYSDFLMKLFKEISNHSGNSQYICTRPQFTDEFKFDKYFSKRIYKLVPLNENDQVEYLKKYFALQNITEENIDQYIQKVFHIIQSLESKTKFNNNFGDLRIPLVLNMISELISNDNFAYGAENIYQIYEKFVQRKIDIWVEKTSFASDFLKRIRTNRKFNIINFYHIYALISQSLVLDDRMKDIIEKLSILNLEIPPELTNDEIARMGILYIDIGYQINFVHKTFGEFFFAQYIIDNIYNEDDMSSEEAELRLELFFKIILADGHHIIKDFIKSYLQVAIIENHTTKFPKKIAHLMVTKYKKLFLNLLRTKKIHVIEFLCNFFKKDSKIVQTLLQVYSNETLFTARYNPTYYQNYGFNFNDFSYAGFAIKIGKTFLNSTEYDNFIHGNNQKGVMLYGKHFLYKYFNINSSYETEKTIYNDDLKYFENLAINLTKNEFLELLSSIDSPIYLGDPLFTTENFWKVIEDLLNENEQKMIFPKILNEISKITFYDYEVLSNFSLIASKIEKIMISSEIYYMFLNGKFLHQAVDSFASYELLFNLFKNHTNIIQQEDILDQMLFVDCIVDINSVTKMEICYEKPPYKINSIDVFSQIER
ncbi:hypothetical protein ACKWTF_006107 [Chironomus riparius]